MGQSVLVDHPNNKDGTGTGMGQKRAASTAALAVVAILLDEE